MIELSENQLHFRFPEVHPRARCTVEFQRTLRIPDDNREHPLPPGLGRFPLEHVDDFADRLPPTWRRHGGVFLPMYQAEALWINIAYGHNYPCAIKVAAGKINALTGDPWSDTLNHDPQDYMVSDVQPWLDGFNVAKGRIRQFVAAPLGEGYTAEEQLTGKAKFGGLQIVVYPMKAEWFRRGQDRIRSEAFSDSEQLFDCLPMSVSEMGMAPGGLMRQQIFEDRHGVHVWDQDAGSRCFIHLANSATYAEITGHAPPTIPPTANDYTAAGLPWFDFFDADAKALEGSEALAALDSVEAKKIKKGEAPSVDNTPDKPKKIVTIKGVQDLVREGEF